MTPEPTPFRIPVDVGEIDRDEESEHDGFSEIRRRTIPAAPRLVDLVVDHFPRGEVIPADERLRGAEEPETTWPLGR